MVCPCLSVSHSLTYGEKDTPPSLALPLSLSLPETWGLNVLWHYWINRLSSSIPRMTETLGRSNPHAITQPDQGVGQTRGRGPCVVLLCPSLATNLAFPSVLPPGMLCSLLPQNLKAKQRETLPPAHREAPDPPTISKGL